MKKIIFIGIIISFFLIVLIGCNKDTNLVLEKPVFTETIAVEKMENVDSISITAIVYANTDNSEIENYSQFILDEYNIELEINLLISYDPFGKRTAALIEEENGGIYLLYTSNQENITELANNSEILPLNEYLDNNEVWESLPLAFKEMYSIGDNKVWAIPRSFSREINSRIYKKSFLDLVGLSVPSSPAELYEVTKKVNETNNKKAIVYNSILSFNDIFHSFETPLALSHTGNSSTSIVYDSLTNSFEDSFLKPNIEMTLNYLSNLTEQNLIVSKESRRNKKSYSSIISSSENYFSSYGVLSSSYLDDDEYIVTYGVESEVGGIIGELTYTNSGGYFLLDSDTINPKEYINTFVSVFYGDEKAYIASRYDIPGENYTYSNGLFSIKNSNFFEISQFSIIGNNPLISINSINTTSSEVDVNEYIDFYKNSTNSIEQYINKGLDEGYILELSTKYAYPQVFPSIDSMLTQNPSANILDELFSSFSRKLISAEDFIKEYIQIMKQTGEQEIIDNLNESIGSYTLYKY